MNSGNGYHVYWKLREPAGVSDESRIQGINLAIATQLRGDPRSCDSAHILRVPNTQNHKYSPPRDVLITHLNGAEYNLFDFEDLLTIQKPAAKPETANYGEVNNERLSRIMACRFMLHCEANAAALTEIEWYCMITQLMKEPGGISLAHKLSKPYPKYNRAETDAKILHALNSTGPMTCDAIMEKTGFICDAECSAKAPASLAFYEEDEFHEALHGCEATASPDGPTNPNIPQHAPNTPTWSNMVQHQNHGLKTLIERYLSEFKGNFMLGDLDEYVKSGFGVERLSRNYQFYRSGLLSEMVKAGQLERTVRGGFRVVDQETEKLNFKNIQSKEHGIRHPDDAQRPRADFSQGSNPGMWKS